MSSDTTDSIVIPNHSLLEALETAEKLDATFGKDCFLVNSFNLKVHADKVDDLIIAGLDLPPSEKGSYYPKTPVRIDRIIELDISQQAELAQHEATFLMAWTAAIEPQQKTIAYQQWQQSRVTLRDRIVLSFVQIDVAPSSLVYGAVIPTVTCLTQPDGRAYAVEVLIHATHPTSAEDLYLREKRVECDRILRYHVPGLDDAQWLKQNEPRETMDAIGWRKLLGDRLH